MEPVRWEQHRRVPRAAAAVLGSLRITGPDTDPLRRFHERDWQDVLAFCDRAQLTLLFGDLASGVEIVRRRMRELRGERRIGPRVYSERASGIGAFWRSRASSRVKASSGS